MQVDAGEVLASIDAVLNVMSYAEENDSDDGDKIQEQRDYIEDTLRKNNIQGDDSELAGQWLVRGDDIPTAVKAFGLSLDDSWTEDCGNGHVLIDLTGSDDVSATLYFTFSEDNVTSMASWLIYK